MKTVFICSIIALIFMSCDNGLPKVNNYEFRSTPIKITSNGFSGKKSITTGFQVLFEFKRNGDVRAISRIYFGEKITEDMLYGTYRYINGDILVNLDKEDLGKTKLLSWSPLTFTYHPESMTVSNPIVNNGQTLEQVCSPKIRNYGY